MAAICDEYESHQDGTGQPVHIGGTVNCSLVEIKAEVPVHDEDPRDDQIIWQINMFNKLNRFHQKTN